MIVRWTSRAIKDLNKTTRENRKSIENAIDEFAVDGTGDVRHLVNSKPPRYRLRVGTWRVIFIRGGATSEKQIDILRVLPRDKAYRS
jgi:mRNA-degrading endonuclease RelE of RelBE toxin-antitoxin system